MLFDSLVIPPSCRPPSGAPPLTCSSAVLACVRLFFFFIVPFAIISCTLTHASMPSTQTGAQTALWLQHRGPRCIRLWQWRCQWDCAWFVRSWDFQMTLLLFFRVGLMVLLLSRKAKGKLHSAKLTWCDECDEQSGMEMDFVKKVHYCERALKSRSEIIFVSRAD